MEILMPDRVSMRSLVRGVAAAVMCAAFVLADCPLAAAAGRFPAGFNGGFHGYYRSLYPYSLFGYPRYHSYWGYYPYSHYEDDCRFEFPKRTAKGKAVQRGVWTCS
jgi:hypothetical protein